MVWDNSEVKVVFTVTLGNFNLCEVVITTREEWSKLSYYNLYGVVIITILSLVLITWKSVK